MSTTAQRVPAIMTGQALNSLRDSGYDLATSIAEPVDNSIEANANNILIRLDPFTDDRGKTHIGQIFIVDDGVGMDEYTLQHYLQLGFSTRYMSKDTIGKYGVGAKLAALNFAKRIDVWSRTAANGKWQHVYFDLAEAIDQEKDGLPPGIDAPDTEPVPPQVAALLPSGSGTVVAWTNIDRLEEGRYATNANELRVEVEKELSRIFRYFLNGGIKIRVNETDLLAHDPLMLMERTWADKVLSGIHQGKDHFPAEVIWRDDVSIGSEKATVTITLFPAEVTRKRGSGGDKVATKLRVPENEGRISFVRLDREVSYTNVPRIFPSAVEPPDRFIGIEVSFKPPLDSFFGIRNVKRGVEPHGDLRIKIRDVLQKHIPTAQKRLQDRWGQVARESEEKGGEHAGVLQAVKEVDRTLPKGRVIGPKTDDEKRQILEDLARDVVGPGEDKRKEREEYLDRIKQLPFVIESVDFPGTHFIDIQFLDGQVLIRLNTRHRFYREMWHPLREIATIDPGAISGAEAVRVARRSLEALALLVVAYGKAESMHPTPDEQYSELRSYWGHFLDSLLGKVKDVV